MTSKQASQHSVLGTFVLPIAQAMRLHGLDPLEVMADLDIDAAKIANPDWRVPQQQFNRLMERCVALSEDEAFGLLAAEQIQPRPVGQRPTIPFFFKKEQGPGRLAPNRKVTEPP